MENMAKKERLINAISYYPSFDQSELHFEYFWADSLCIGRFESGPENKLPVCVHSHEEYEFIIPYSPVNYMLREEQICFGQVGQVYPIPGGIRHGIKYTQTEPVCLDAISIDKEYFDAIKKDKHLESLAIENEFTLTESLRCFIETFKKECRKSTRDENNKLEPLVRLITAELIDQIANQKTPGNITTSLYQQGVRSAAVYINKNYTEDLSIETLAAICGISPGYFTKCFTKMFATSPTQYIALVRVNQAKLLLENTFLPVKEIATRVGYNRSSTFCDAFKRLTEMTPNEWRAAKLGYTEGIKAGI